MGSFKAPVKVLHHVTLGTAHAASCAYSTSELLLPIHLVKEVLCSQEEVVDLAALLVSLSGVVDPQLGLRGQELADVGHREHDLLHGAVLTHNLCGETRAESPPCWPFFANTERSK